VEAPPRNGIPRCAAGCIFVCVAGKAGSASLSRAMQVLICTPYRGRTLSGSPAALSHSRTLTHSRAHAKLSLLRRFNRARTADCIGFCSGKISTHSSPRRRGGVGVKSTRTLLTHTRLFSRLSLSRRVVSKESATLGYSRAALNKAMQSDWVRALSASARIATRASGVAAIRLMGLLFSKQMTTNKRR
jgi:hypothetical protein